MKHIISTIAIMLCGIMTWGAPFNPANPAEPGVLYNLTVTSSPAAGGSTSPSGKQQYGSGTNVSLRAYANNGYTFVAWKENDSIISENSSFSYTLNKNASLVAVFEKSKFNPDAPQEPEVIPDTYKLSLVADPQKGGDFNFTSKTLTEGQQISLYAYPNSDYTFAGWFLDEEKISIDNPYVYTTTAEDVVINGKFTFSPANPPNPGANHWNPSTGELIIDDFSPGKIMTAIDAVLGGSSNRGNVMSVIVSGKMSSSDFGLLNYLTNCTFLDLSRTGGYTEIPDYAFDNCMALTNIILPACIENIGYQAFDNCTSLNDVSCYAVTPPTVESYAFRNIAEGAVLHVLSTSIPQYAEAATWKDFVILPLTNEVRCIEVSLPIEKTGHYKDMILELVNIASGIKQKFVITDRQSYTFNGLIKNSKYDVTLRTPQNVVLGEIKNIEIKNDDVKVAFDSLLSLHNVTLKVVTPSGIDVSSQVETTWFDKNGIYLSQGNTLNSQTNGTLLRYKITLDQALGMTYRFPTVQTGTVTDGANDILFPLTPIDSIIITGEVRDINGGKLSNATIAISQLVNGTYSKSTTTKTDKYGNFSVKVINDYSTIAISAPDYISQTIVKENFADSANIGIIALKPISGATMSISFTYTPSVDSESFAEVENWYSDYQNVTYSIYNVTQNREITQFSYQFPSIVLLEDVAIGDSLNITALSKNNAFSAVTAGTKIGNDNNADITIGIVAKGGIKATYNTTENFAVTGMLYGNNGELLKKQDYSNKTLTFDNLADGNYTLVSMANSSLFNSVLKLSQLSSLGLSENTDYLKDSFVVKSGVIATVNHETVPTLDESKLYYTGENTSFSANKSSIVAGNYLTLKGQIDFKAAYANGVSNVNMIIDLPESCSFIDNSVMVGSNIASYVIDGNSLTIPLSNYSELVRFCVIPTIGGKFQPNAFVEFDYNGKSIKQPIGAAHYEVKDLSISVPGTVAKTIVPINGTAIGKSSIEIFDNDVLIGQTTAIAGGTWNAICELNEAYNLSTHNIYAKVTTPQGLKLQTETQQCQYDMNAIQINKVIMYHWNPEMRETFQSVFDFQNPASKPNQWTVYYPKKKFTYTIEFTNNSPEYVSNVILYVHAANGQIVPLKPVYDESKDLWTAEIDMGNRSDSYYPVNVSVDFDADTDVKIDRNRFSKFAENINTEKSNKVEIIDSVNSINNEIQQIDDTQITKRRNYTIWQEHINNDENIENSDSLLMLYLNQSGGNYKVSDFHYELPDTINNEYIKNIINSCYSLLNNSDTPIDLSKYNDYFLSLDSIISNPIGELDEYASLRTIESDTISIDTQNGSINIYQVPLSNLDISNIEITDTVCMSMTEGKQVIAFTSEKNIVIVDSLRNEAWIIHNIQSKPSIVAMSSNNGFVAAMNKAKNDISNLTSTLITFIKGLISETNDELDELREILSNIETEKGLMASRSAAKQIEAENIQKEINRLLSKDVISVDEYFEIVKRDELIKQLKAERKIILDEICDLDDAVGKLAKRSKGISAKIIAGTAVLGTLHDAYEVIQGLKTTCIYINQAINDHNKWDNLINKIEPCKGEATKAAALKKVCQDDWTNIAWKQGYYPAFSISGITTIVNGYMMCNKGAKIIAQLLVGVVTEFLNNTSESMFNQAKFTSNKLYPIRYAEYKKLNCKKDPDDPDNPNNPDDPDGPDDPNNPDDPDDPNDPDGPDDPNNPNDPDDPDNPKNDKDGGDFESGQDDDKVRIDPSGFVYEGVESNRLAGVTATCYYKEMVEDMYGDLHENIVLWDAAEYAQENPLFTDENGMYRWDVPQGLWQVKFEKTGYQTTYSDWLPVPPPQLEVNVGMTQLAKPEVIAARSYEDAIEIDFSKYMITDYLNNELITVTQNDKVIVGEVVMLNSENSLASKVRYQFAQPLSEGDKITLTVSKKVRSYADIMMESDFSQEFDIAVKPAIKTPEKIEVIYDNNKEIIVTLSPAKASVGKKVTVASSSSQIASVEPSEAIIDENGRATFTVTGELPGAALLQFSVESDGLIAESEVNVVRYDNRTIYRDYALNSGWNWISVNLSNDTIDNPSKLFEPIKTSLNKIVSASEELSYNTQTGFTGTLTSINPVYAYKVKMALNDTLTICGKQDAMTVTLNQGWNWIGYTPQGSQSVIDAFKNVAECGDVIMGRNAFAIYSGSEWRGTLSTMEPGMGYMYKSCSTKSFNYQPTNNDVTFVPTFGNTSFGNWICNPMQYADNMAIIAKVKSQDGTEISPSQCVIIALVGDECRGIALNNSDNAVFLTVHGETIGEKVRFQIYDITTNTTYWAKESVSFNQELLGSIDSPTVLHCGEIGGVENVEYQPSTTIYPNPVKDVLHIKSNASSISFEIIDASGNIIMKQNEITTNKGINISNLPNGIYFINIIENGKAYTHKIIKKP